MGHFFNEGLHTSMETDIELRHYDIWGKKREYEHGSDQIAHQSEISYHIDKHLYPVLD